MQQNAVNEEDERKHRLEEEKRRAEMEKNKNGEKNAAPVFLSYGFEDLMMCRKMNREAYSENTMTFSQRVSSRRNFQLKNVD